MAENLKLIIIMKNQMEILEMKKQNKLKDSVDKSTSISCRAEGTSLKTEGGDLLCFEGAIISLTRDLTAEGAEAGRQVGGIFEGLRKNNCPSKVLFPMKI